MQEQLQAGLIETLLDEVLDKFFELLENQADKTKTQIDDHIVSVLQINKPLFKLALNLVLDKHGLTKSR